MPAGDYRNIAPILTVLEALGPSSVLEVGCGFGTYGMLLREYFDPVPEAASPIARRVRIDGVDAREEHRNPIWDFAYDRVYVQDIRRLIGELPCYDLGLISHMSDALAESEASEFVAELHQRCGMLVIATPKPFCPELGSRGPSEPPGQRWSEKCYPSGLEVSTIPALTCDIFISERRRMPAAVSSSDTRATESAGAAHSTERTSLRRPERVPLSAVLRASARRTR